MTAPPRASGAEALICEAVVGWHYTLSKAMDHHHPMIFRLLDADLDDVAGMVLVRDVLLLDEVERAEKTAGDLLRPVVSVSPDDLTEDVLLLLQSGDAHVALVVSNSGLTLGLVTLRDLIEEAVGDLAEPPVRVKVQGRLRSVRHNARRRTPMLPESD